MKFAKLPRITSLALLTLLAIPPGLGAAEGRERDSRQCKPRALD